MFESLYILLVYISEIDEVVSDATSYSVPCNCMHVKM